MASVVFGFWTGIKKGLSVLVSVMEERVSRMGEKRPWGEYVVIGSDSNYKVKLITIYPHSRLSLQKHKYRAEEWYIVDGVADIELDGYFFKATAGERIHVFFGVPHRIGAREQQVRFIEIQRGSYFGEDDIERLEDDYGRI